MKKSLYSLIITLILTSPMIGFGADSYIGNSLGLDFYSVIDDGNYTLVNQMVNVEMQKKPTLGQFGEGCPNINLVADKPTSTEILDYKNLSDALKDKKISTEGYQALALCLNKKYDELVAQKSKESDRLQKISSIGLYTDGNKENSDYDIVSDVGLIDTLIFTEPAKYNGVVNGSRNSLAQYLRGEPTPSLFPQIRQNIAPSPTGTGNTDTSSGTTSESGSMSLIGDLCTQNTTTIPLDELVDENFLEELNQTLEGDASYEVASTTSSGNLTQSGAPEPKEKTSASDFFHPPGSCGGLFCIDIRFVSGTQNLLGGGAGSRSVEGLLDKHTKILEPISMSSLRHEGMTNQMGELPFDKVKWAEVLSGIKVYYNTKPQQQKRLKSEATPKSEEEELLQMQRCAYATAGISTDTERANGPLVAGYSINTASNTETVGQQVVTTTAQDPSQKAIGNNCFDLYMDEGRKEYANTLSTDVAEIEAFTRSMIQIVTDIINIGSQLDKKPAK